MAQQLALAALPVELGSISQHPCGCSQASVSLVPSDLTASSGIMYTYGAQIYI